MDGLRLCCALTPAALPSSPLPFQVDALVLQGALCSAPAGLAPVSADAPVYSPVPTLHFAWVESNVKDPYPPERSTVVPLYLDLDRSTLLGELRLPCAGSEHQWLQAGAALFLQADEE